MGNTIGGYQPPNFYTRDGYESDDSGYGSGYDPDDSTGNHENNIDLMEQGFQEGMEIQKLTSMWGRMMDAQAIHDKLEKKGYDEGKGNI